MLQSSSLGPVIVVSQNLPSGQKKKKKLGSSSSLSQIIITITRLPNLCILWNNKYVSGMYSDSGSGYI